MIVSSRLLEVIWLECDCCYPHSNHMTFSNIVDTLIYQTTIHRDSSHFLYVSGHVTLGCLKFFLVAYASNVNPWQNMGKLECAIVLILIPSPEPSMHGGDTSWPKQFQNGGPQAIYETLHIEYRIVCCIATYLIHIYHMSKCSKCNWNRYIEGFCTWNVHFHINGLSTNIAYVILMSWSLMAIYSWRLCFYYSLSRFLGRSLHRNN